MQFYWVIDQVILGQFLVYWMAVEQNMSDCFIKHHPTNHHRAQQRLYIFRTVDVIKYELYMSSIDLQGFVESLPTQLNWWRKDKVSLLHGKEMDDG